MKKVFYILFIILLLLSFSACRWEYRDDNYDTSQTSLNGLLEKYDLWYVDIDQTAGTGNIPFISRAFTISFMPSGAVYANNNMVGLGETGNGFGINTGVYHTDERNGILYIDDDVFGSADFVVKQLSENRISLNNRYENVTYFLEGYQQNEFDYDRLFYENIVYFLQEYESWTRNFSDILDHSAPFVSENHLKFYVSGNENVFESSESLPATPLSYIDWDYTGYYEVTNTYSQSRKELILNYDIDNSNETFILKVISDDEIELHNIYSDNIYRFHGRGYIQFKPAGKSRNKHKKPEQLKPNRFIKI